MHVHVLWRYADNSGNEAGTPQRPTCPASRRGHKGFSAVLSEAIESFLQGEVEREKRRKALLSLGGSLSKNDREELLRSTK